MPIRSNMCCARRGFTLVELLVVIGMIAILMSILLPAVNKVRQRARAAECAANLHTFGQAWQMYAANNSGTCVPGRLPTAGAPGGVFGIGNAAEYRPRWYELLGEQVAQFANNHPGTMQDDRWTISNRLFLCPAIPEWNNSRNYPYGYNYQFLGNARPKEGGGWISYPVKSSRINGARTVLAADCLGTAAGKPKNQRTHYYSDGSHDPAGLCNKGWCLDPPRMTGDSDYADPQHRSPSDRSGPDARHQGKCNVLFCDGHVELIAPQDMGYVVNPDGSIPISGPRATNMYFSGSGADIDPPPFRPVAQSNPLGP